MSEQPMPKRCKASAPVADQAEIEYLDAHLLQVEKGLAKYGMVLQTFNGRNAHADALSELADAVQYVTQMGMERDEIVRRAQGMAKAIHDRARSALLEGNAASIAWHLEKNGEPDVEPAALALWLRGVAAYIAKLRAALAAWDELGLDAETRCGTCGWKGEETI